MKHMHIGYIVNGKLVSRRPARTANRENSQMAATLMRAERQALKIIAARKKAGAK